MKTKSIRIRIPEDVHKRLEVVLHQRSLTIEEAAVLYLRSMVYSAERGRALMLNDTLPFGKYQGSTVETVIKAQPDYIRWLLVNSKTFSLEVEAMELLRDVEEV